MSDELFDAPEREERSESRSAGPLAERMRPRTLEEVARQAHLLGPDKLLARLFDLRIEEIFEDEGGDAV